MNLPRKNIKALLLTGAITWGVLVGGTPNGKAANFESYYSAYQTNIANYNSTHTTTYLYKAYAYLYYYFAGYYGDYYGYNSDTLGEKSIYYKSKETNPAPPGTTPALTATYQSAWYNYYAYYGDYFWGL